MSIKQAYLGRFGTTAALVMVRWVSAMSYVHIFIVSLFLLVSAVGYGQQPRGNLFDQVSQLRLEMERLTDLQKELIKKRDELSIQFNTLAGQINQHKSTHSSGTLIPDFTLQEMLRKSQDLSESLTSFNRELEAMKGLRKDRLEQLSTLYQKLIEQTVQDVRGSEGRRKTELVQLLGKIRKDREQIRLALSEDSTREPSSRFETKGLLASEDPDELVERADAVYDEQNRLRKRLASLDQRIQELNSELRLDQDMRDFLDDHALFNEDSRVLQVTKTTVVTTPDSKKGTDGNNGSPTEQPQDGYDWEGGDQDPRTNGGDDSLSGDVASEPHGTGAGNNPDTRLEIHHGQIPAHEEQQTGQVETLRPHEQIKVLQEQRQQLIQRMKELQNLYNQLQEKAEDLQEH